MTIYVEVILLNNLFVNFFLLQLTFGLTKGKIKLFRIFLSALLGAIFSAIYPFIGSYRYIIKVFLAPIMIVIAKGYRTFSEFLLALVIFLAMSFSMAGAMVMAASFLNTTEAKLTLSMGMLPLFFALSGSAIFILIQYVQRELLRVRRKESNLYSVRIENENMSQRALAFYDTGNKVYTNNGECVVILDCCLYNKLLPTKEECVMVKTVHGIQEIPVVDADLWIYSEDGGNRLYKVKAGKSDISESEYKIILHSDMSGE